MATRAGRTGTTLAGAGRFRKREVKVTRTSEENVISAAWPTRPILSRTLLGASPPRSQLCVPSSQPDSAEACAPGAASLLGSGPHRCPRGRQYRGTQGILPSSASPHGRPAGKPNS